MYRGSRSWRFQGLEAPFLHRDRGGGESCREGWGGKGVAIELVALVALSGDGNYICVSRSRSGVVGDTARIVRGRGRSGVGDDAARKWNE